MSPHVGNFVHDLVEMAKAMERVPGLESEIARLQDMVDNYAQQVQAIELRAIDRNTEIGQLNAKIRSLEVERDDASFRVMEAEDREHSLLSMAKAAATSLEQMTKLLNPPKPEPEPAPVVSAAPDWYAPISPPEPEVAAEPSHLGAPENVQEPAPIDPHQTEAPVSVSADPTPATDTSDTPSLDSQLIGTSIQGSGFDLEPNERWSSEWYAWKDRQAKADHGPAYGF